MIDKNSDPHLRLSEAATYWGSFVGEHYLRLPLFAKLRQTIEAGLLQRNLPERGKMPVPAIDPAGITPQQFRRGYITSRGRTGYHCAAGGNFCVQVYGRKRWVFVNPRHTPFIYPVIRKDFFYSGSTVDDRMGRDELFQAGRGLYSCIPKYEVVLDPGDVLYSPQWWWHTVDNLGPSIGVSMRFLSAPFASNPVYSTMTMLSPNVVRHFFQVIRTGWGVDRTGARTLFEPEPSEAKAPPASRPAAKTEAAGRL